MERISLTTGMVLTHSICLLPSATKLCSKGGFTHRLLPLTTSSLLFYAPTVCPSRDVLVSVIELMADTLNKIFLQL